jgi:DNA polymerase-4
MHTDSIRKIIHLDLDAFYCAVEEQHNPELKGRPFAVGGRPGQRGVVASCSYPARSQGVRSAMPMSRAMRLCPELEIVPARHDHYRQMSRKVMAILRETTTLVEQLSIDEAFLDVTGLDAPTEEIAEGLQSRINRELGLPCSLGVAENKLVAKIANDYGKSQKGKLEPPNTITVVPPGTSAAFLKPLPVRALWGVGPKTAERLAELDIFRIGELAEADPATLESMFGKNGPGMVRRARGEDHSPVVTHREAKSISQETTFAQDTSNPEVLRERIERQAYRIASQLEKKRLRGTTVRIKVRWPDFTTLSRQTTFSQPTDEPEIIFQAAWKLFNRTWKKGRRVRLLGVGISGLTREARQLSLWDPPQDDSEADEETTND